MSSSKAAIDDLDNLPDAVTPPAGSRKKARTITWKDSQLCLYRYNDEFCGDSIWLHCDLNDIDKSGCFKPEFSALGKVVGNSKINKEMMEADETMTQMVQQKEWGLRGVCSKAFA